MTDISRETPATTLQESAVPQLLTILGSLSSRIAFLWQFYAALNLAIVGWLFASKSIWSAAQRLSITAIYVIAIAVSLALLVKTYRWITVLLRELNAAAETLQTHTVDFKLALTTVNARFWQVTLVGHLVIDITVIWLLLTRTS